MFKLTTTVEFLAKQRPLIDQFRRNIQKNKTKTELYQSKVETNFQLLTKGPFR